MFDDASIVTTRPTTLDANCTELESSQTSAQRAAAAALNLTELALAREFDIFREYTDEETGASANRISFLALHLKISMTPEEPKIPSRCGYPGWPFNGPNAIPIRECQFC